MEDTSNKIAKDIPPLDPGAKVFALVLSKGDECTILKGDSGLANSIVARALLNAIILP